MNILLHIDTQLYVRLRHLALNLLSLEVKVYGGRSMTVIVLKEDYMTRALDNSQNLCTIPLFRHSRSLPDGNDCLSVFQEQHYSMLQLFKW